MKWQHVASALAALAFAGAPATLDGQGFGLNEIGSCAIARGFAVTSRPCDDASAIYWNPAALTALDGRTLLVGATAIAVGGNFTADRTGRVDEGDVPVEVPPHLFANWTTSRYFDRRIGLGLGVYVPYGLTSQWRPDFPGRFTAERASLASVYVQPNLALELIPGRLSVGAGPTIGHSTLELRQSADLATVRTSATGPTFGQLGIAGGTEFARGELSGSSWGYGFNVGAHAHLTDDLQAGVRYLSRIDFDYDGGTATFTQVPTGIILPQGNPIVPGGASAPLDPILAAQFAASGALASQAVATQIVHPAQFQGGLTFSGWQRTAVSLEYNWIGWSAFREIPVNFAGGATDRTLYEDFEDSWSVRTGAERTYRSGWRSRLGFSYVKSPAPDVTVSPLLPDMDRWNYMIGLGLPFGGRYMLDASYLTVQTQGRRGRIVERTDRSQTAEQLNSGVYSLNANIFSLSLRAHF